MSWSSLRHPLPSLPPPKKRGKSLFVCPRMLCAMLDQLVGFIILISREKISKLWKSKRKKKNTFLGRQTNNFFGLTMLLQMERRGQRNLGLSCDKGAWLKKKKKKDWVLKLGTQPTPSPLWYFTDEIYSIAFLYFHIQSCLDKFYFPWFIFPLNFSRNYP